MKNIRKVLIYLLFFIVTIFSFNNKVEATDETWDYLFAPGLFNNAFANSEYCVYPRYNVFEIDVGVSMGDVVTKIGNLYNGENLDEQYKYFAFILFNGEIYFPTVNAIKHQGNGGIAIVNTSEMNASGSGFAGGYNWNEDMGQEIYFKSSLKDYLIVDGKLECKDLIFEQKNGDLIVYRGDELLYNDLLNLKNYEPHITLKNLYDAGVNSGDYSSYNYASYLNKLVVSGTHHYALDVEHNCKVYQEELTKLESIYERDIYNIYVNLKGLSQEILKKDTYADWKAVKYEKDVEIINSNLDTLAESLDELKLAVTDDKEYFNITKCENINDAYTMYKRISVGPTGIEQSLSTITNNVELAVDKYGSEEAKKAIDNTQNVLEKMRIKWEDYLNKIKLGSEFANRTCEGLLGPDLLDDISMVLTWVRIAVPIIVIVLGSVDFAKAVISDDQQQIKKSTSTFVKRCIIAVAIFFVPSLIMYILSFIDMIADVSCDIRLW